MVAEISYPAADLSLCTGPGVRYPDGEARMGHIHSMQVPHLRFLQCFQLN